MKLNHEKRKNTRTGLKYLTPSKLLTRFLILLAQVKAENNSNKSEIRKILYLLYQHNKIMKNLQQFHQVIILIEENMVVIREAKIFFDLDWPKNVGKNLKHEIEFLIKRNESLAENKIKKEIEQLLLKYKRGNDIHEHGKQQNE